jgi:O-antigen ligase
MPPLIAAGLIPPQIATVIFIVGILGLFILDRDQKSRTSKALWIPTFWLLLAGSRPVSLWFGGGTASSAETYNVEANPMNVAVFAVLLVAGLCVLFHRAQKVGAVLQANWPILLFFFYCALSAVWSDFAGAAIRKWVRSTGDLVMVLIVLTDPEPLAALKRLFARAAFVLMPLSVLFIKYYPNLGRMYSNGWENMFTGVADHKNDLGMFCMILGLGFLWRFLEHYQDKDDPERKRRLRVDGITLFMVGWLLWMAHSMTSTGCFVMAAPLIVVTHRFAPGRKLGVVHLLVFAVVSLSLFAVFFQSGGGLVESVGRTASLTSRSEIWHQVLGMAQNPWFGSGFESFWLGDRIGQVWDSMPGARINQAHNGYIEVYLNLGLCGIALLALLIVTGYRNVIVALRRGGNLGSLRLACFVAALVFNLSEAGFRMITYTWIFFLLAITAVPAPAAPEASPGPGIEGAEAHAEPEAEVPHVLATGSNGWT